MKVRLTSKAKLHARNEREWWSKNRDAKQLFSQELRAVRKELAHAPKLQVYEEIDGRVVRKLLMKKTHHTIYYWISDATQVVWIMALWGQCRGEEPELGEPT